MSGEEKTIDRKLSTLSDRFGLRGRPRATPNVTAKSKPSVGLSSKRTFSPNIVSRSIKKEETTDKSHPQFKEKRGRGFRGGRGRGRGRGRGDNIIQSTSVFSHGVFAQPTLAKALGGDFNYGGGSAGSAGSSGSSKIFTKAEKIEDDSDCIESGRVIEAMKDEGKIDIDETKSGNLAPITLPLASKLAQNFKQEGLKSDPEDEDELKPSMLKPSIKQSKAPAPIEIAELIEEKSTDGQLLFFQFPDTLPIKPISSEDDPMVKEEPGLNSSNKETVNKDITNELELEEQLRKFTFKNVSEGFIGKLCVHRSGKVKMHLGNVSLDLTLGTPCGFLQDLVSVQTDNEPAEMISLGHINHRLICIPDYKSLLGSVGD